MKDNKEMVEKFLKALAMVEAEGTSPEKAEPKPVKNGKSAEAIRAKNNKIIEYLKSEGGATIEDIQKHIGYSKANTTLSLSKLVKKGTLEYTRTSPRVYSIKGFGESNGDKWSGKVIDYVTANMGKRYSLQRMGRDLGMPDGVVYGVAHRLEKRGLIPHGFNLGSVEEAPVPQETAPKAEEKPSTETTSDDKPEAPQGDSLLQQIEFLIWTYVRENRDTDVLKFLTWLETK